MKKVLTSTIALLSIFGSSSFLAAEELATETFTSYSVKKQSGISVGVQISTLGAGITAELPVGDFLAVRGSLNTLTFSVDEVLSDVDYELDVSSFSTALMVDFHPLKGNFRLTGGVLFHSTDMNGFGDLRNGIEIGGRHYDNTEVSTVSADLDYPSLLPYVGLGFGSSWGRSEEWGISFDIGLAFISSPDLQLSATGTVTSEPAFESVLNEERHDAEQDISDIPVYPVISLGLNYRF